MAVLENGFPFDNVEYDATALGAWLSTRTRGVFSAEDHYTVTLAGGMQVNVSSGMAWLKMNEQWGMVAPNPAAISLTVDVGDTILNRIDVVCLRIDKNQSVQEVVVKKGSLAASPVYPALVRDLNYDEIFLAAISVPAGTTELNAGLLTDLRLDETYCGLMRDGVTGIPTAQLQAQAEALIASLQEVIDGVIDGSQYMLKTQYAPDATATIADDALVIVSDNTHIQTEYDVRFTMPAGAFTSVTIDGVAMTGIYDTSGDDADFEPAAGVPVTLTRQGDRAFFKTGGGGFGIRVITAASFEDLPMAAKEGTVALVGAELEMEGKPYCGPSEPDGERLWAGRVWLPNDSNSEMYLINTEDMALPVKPPQYRTETGWTSPEAYIVQGGVWQAFEAIWYERGREVVPFSATTQGAWSGGTLVKHENHMRLITSSGLTAGIMATNDPVDLTTIDKIQVVLSTQVAETSNYRPRLWVNKAREYLTTGLTEINITTSAGAEAAAKLDVSVLTGAYYIGVTKAGRTTSDYCDIHVLKEG